MKFAALLALAFAVLATPEIVDVHSTGLGLKQISHSQNHDVFAVTVKRVDDLFDVDEKGNVKEIGLRYTNVLLEFDVDSSGQITCNDQPVPYGLSLLKLKANVVTGIKKEALETQSEDEIKQQFDKGIVGVKISATGKKVELDGVIVQQITITEKIVEVNGHEAEQSEAMQQVLEIYPDGNIKKSDPAPCDMSLDSPQDSSVPSMQNMQSEPSAEEPKKKKHHKHRFSLKSLARWYRHQSPIMRILIAIVSGALLGLISVALLQLVTFTLLSFGLLKKRRESKDIEGVYIEKVIFDSEKATLLQGTQTEDLPAYYEKGYQKVDTNEH